MPADVKVLQLGSARVGRHGYPLVVADADMIRHFSDLHPPSVTAMTLIPGQPENWFLLAAICATKPGRFRVAGIEVSYEVGWRHSSTIYYYTAEIDAAK